MNILKNSPIKSAFISARYVSPYFGDINGEEGIIIEYSLDNGCSVFYAYVNDQWVEVLNPHSQNSRIFFQQGCWYYIDDDEFIVKQSPDGIFFSRTNDIKHLNQYINGTHIHSLVDNGCDGIDIILSTHSRGTGRSDRHTVDAITSRDNGATWECKERVKLGFTVTAHYFSIGGNSFIFNGNIIYQIHDDGSYTFVEKFHHDTCIGSILQAGDSVLIPCRMSCARTTDGFNYTIVPLCDSGYEIFINEVVGDFLWTQAINKETDDTKIYKHSADGSKISYTLDGFSEPQPLIVNISSGNLCFLTSNVNDIYCLARIDHNTKTIIPI